MPVRPAALTVVLALIGGACVAPTRLTATWKAPDATDVRFKKVIVVAQTPDRLRRQAIESHLAKRIDNAFPSYDLLTDDEVRSADRAKAKVVAAGFDGAIVVRFVGVTQQTTYVPGTVYWGSAPYGSMWGYWGYGWGTVYEPGYLQTDQVVTLESNVYSVLRDALIWSSRSETVSPGSIDELMGSVLDATVQAMRRQNLI